MLSEMWAKECEMAELGRLNRLDVVKKKDFGFYLDGQELGEILLPIKYAPADCYVGEELEVFLYKDSEDRLIAVTTKPFALVGEFTALRVVSTGTVGAFLDWGLEKDLFLPYGEQRCPVFEGQVYVVFVYIDNSGRIAASTRVERHASSLVEDVGLMLSFQAIVKSREAVDLLVYGQSELGFNCIVNGCVCGLVFRNELFKPLKVGQQLTGYVKRVREDGKLDLTLERPGYEKIGDFADVLLERLKGSGGFLPLTDKSSPEDISAVFETSKKNFKKAVGALYKARKISIEEAGIRLI